MKYLVLATCLSLSAAQGFYGLVGAPNGAVVPVDEPRVAAAKADHLATKFGHGGPVIAGPAISAPLVAAPAIAAPAYPGYAAGYGYAGPLNLNTHLVTHPNGAVVPLDEPAVAARRAEHFAAGGGQVHGVYGGVYGAGYGYGAGYRYAPYAGDYHYAGPLNLNTHLVAHPNGAVVPLDEPAVAARRAEHFAAQEASYAAAAPIVAAPAIAAPAIAAPAIAAPAIAAPIVHGYAGPLNLNTQLVGHPNGAVVPLDEPAVAAARADHFAAGGGRVHAAPIVAAPVVAPVAPIAAPIAPVVAAGYAGPLNLNTHLVAHPNGAVVPADEPAVAAARADHFAAKGGIY